jgi:hypothetical protein
MSSWGNNDNAANTPLWGSMTVNRAPTTANQTALYANTTANNVSSTLADGSIRNAQKTVGLFGVDSQEMATSRANTLVPHPCSTGWVLKTTGQGGRAGRITHEVLVALANLNGDGDQQIYANVMITLVTSGTATVAANASFANNAVFTVSPTLSGNTSATLTYQWQYNNSTGTFGWANIPANTAIIRFQGATTPTLLAIPSNTANNTNVFRVTVTAANQGVVATSSNNTLSVPV